jgi:N4-gp56 family major capsid protein
MPLNQPANPPYLDLPNATDFHSTLDADVKAKIWSEVVKRDAMEKNILRDFKGEEGSNKPISTKKDLAAGGSDTVTFTTTTPIRGQGVIGEAQLKGNTDHLRFGSFSVTVDMIRHAVSYTQLLKLLRFTGQTVDQLSSEVMADWAARKEQDECMLALRNAALNQQLDGAGVNVVNVGGKVFLGASADATSADTLSTDHLELSKSRLLAQGGKPMQIDTDLSGADIPQYLIFGPDTLMRPLREDSTYLDALRYNTNRGDDNHRFKGSYPVWDNNIIHTHNMVVDTADGRQGSPLAPRAYLGNGPSLTITDANFGNDHDLLGGGVAYAGGDLDYFANFTGFAWHFTTADQVATPSTVETNQVHYVTVYDLVTRNWCVFSYDRSKISQNQITDATPVLRGDARNPDGWAGTGDDVVLGQGSVIYQSNKAGIPVEFGLHLGANALYYAVGSKENEPIYHYDDFANASGQAHLTATGVQSIRGLRTYQDTIGRQPNFLLTVGAAVIPGVHLSD